MNGTAKHNPKALDKTKFPKPRDRQLVKLRCPAKTCSDEQVVWLCSVCHGQLEHYEELIYCDCGRYGPSAVTFNCNKQAHGTGFVGFSSKHLLRHLGKLQQYRCLNILLLGETGVGKSTFINAFVNYLMFNTLDDAIQEEKLRWLIPFKFSYPDMSGPNRKPVHIEVCAGHNKNELDGSAGSSATQKTKVYRLKIGDTVIRLIDTPGIGDTRGFDQDKKNMANVLSTLGGLEELHGILFLLKPTMSRLTPAVRWCVKELLTHLHKDAARNLVFGFTNTRQAGYTPGDSYKPLESLLNEVDIALGGEIVYSFDSEGFRFLAALKQARNELDGIDAFRRSWERSKKEIHRLLHHFQMLQPHAIQSTISLNRARELITALTRPMADITGSIEDTIRINTERLSELQDSRCKGDELKAKLHFQRVIIHATKLARPRTVCCDQACVEYRDIGTGENRPVYKTLCHDPCYLSDVDADVIGHGNLTKCWAMNRTDWCRRCSHHWQQHLHFQWQQEEMVVEERDNNVARQIRDNESEIQVKETAIKSIKQKTDKAKAVRQEIRDAAVQFGLFLKHKSITPYNDETISYLDMLIKEEKQTAQYAKSVGLGGSKRQTDRLNSLIRSQNEYRERIAVFEQANETAKKQLLDERSVDGLIQRLYCLESWGPNLRVIMKLAKKATSSFSSEQEFNGPWRQSLTNDSNWVASQASEDESSSVYRPRNRLGNESSSESTATARQACRNGSGCRESDCKFEHPPAPPCHNGKDCYKAGCTFSHPRPSHCKDGTGCRNGECPFSHPWQRPKSCRNGPGCREADCKFEHPPAPQCRNGKDCYKDGCTFSHPRLRHCKDAAKCRNQACAFAHPWPRPKFCRNGPGCREADCSFEHPPATDCRNGKDCYKSGCTFSHPRPRHCSNGPSCRSEGCALAHLWPKPKLCKSGFLCRDKDCKLEHPSRG